MNGTMLFVNRTDFTVLLLKDRVGTGAGSSDARRGDVALPRNSPTAVEFNALPMTVSWPVKLPYAAMRLYAGLSDDHLSATDALLHALDGFIGDRIFHHAYVWIATTRRDGYGLYVLNEFDVPIDVFWSETQSVRLAAGADLLISATSAMFGTELRLVHEPNHHLRTEG